MWLFITKLALETDTGQALLFEKAWRISTVLCPHLVLVQVTCVLKLYPKGKRRNDRWSVVERRQRCQAALSFSGPPDFKSFKWEHHLELSENPILLGEYSWGVFFASSA